MPAGRPRKPNELKSLQGTERKDRKVDALEVLKFEDITQIKVEKMRGLETALAKKIFNEKANQLIANKMLAPQDLEQLVIYANAYNHLVVATKEIKKGMFSELHDDLGNLKGYIANPYIKLFKEMSEIIIRIGAEFGFSPLSRMKFKIETEKPEDPFEKLNQQFNQLNS